MRPPATIDRGLLSGSGPSVPEDGEDGWQPGAIFHNTKEGVEFVFYVNMGTVESAMFKPLLPFDPS